MRQSPSLISLGTVWMAPGRNGRNFVREFPKVGEVYLVGVPVDRLIGIAYEQHPKDIVFEGTLGRAANHDAIVRPRDRQLDTAHRMLREALARELRSRPDAKLAKA